MRSFNLVFIVMVLFFSSHLFALSCKQSEVTQLSNAHQQTALLSEQFTKIAHIEVLPHTIIPEEKGFKVETVQVLICGELPPQTPRKISNSATTAKEATTVPGSCQFDSDCSRPKRCLNNRCLMPNAH